MIQEQEIVLKGEKKVTSITLKNKNGMEITFLSLGGIIRSIKAADREGKFENILLDYEDVNDYVENPGYLNAIIGRIAGRIHEAKFSLKQKEHNVFKNDGENTLHGGRIGFDKKIWEVQTFSNEKGCGANLFYTSPDEEENYPGELKTEVTYFLDHQDTFTITYKAVASEDTLVNLTQHAYFNLSGEGKRTIEDQVLQMESDFFCELDEKSIPTGKLLSVKENTPFDFTNPKKVGEHISDGHVQLTYTKGYDHPWILEEAKPNLVFQDPVSGRKMELTTNQKAVVVYAMNYENPCLFTNGKKNVIRDGICFETQALPIGHKECFKEGAVLKKGEQYFHQTSFSFSVIK
jgi:aldose 1-epimerase